MTEDFMHQNIVNLKIVKSKLFNVAEKEWRADVISKPKPKKLEIFKTDLQPANYLQILCLNLKDHSLHNLGLVYCPCA